MVVIEKKYYCNSGSGGGGCSKRGVMEAMVVGVEIVNERVVVATAAAVVERVVALRAPETATVKVVGAAVKVRMVVISIVVGVMVLL